MRALGQTEFLAQTALELARAGLETGTLEAARVALAEVLPLAEEANSLPEVLGQLAQYAQRRGRPFDAARLCGHLGPTSAHAAPALQACREALAPAALESALMAGASMMRAEVRALAQALLAADIEARH